jgi:S1-C subfamily serine protease
MNLIEGKNMRKTLFFILACISMSAIAGPIDYDEFRLITTPKSLKSSDDYSKLKQSASVITLSALAGISVHNTKAPPNLRGAAEVSIFQRVAKGTVLIVADDGLGSGAVITKSGYILTNKHVVGDAKKVKVFFYPTNANGDFSKATESVGTVQKINEFNDLALLKVPKLPASASPIPLKIDEPPAVGEDAHAVGHPRGEPWTYTRGYVSQIRAGYEWKTEENGISHYANIIQTQTPINPGNSGGPLVNSNGQLIGINSFVSSASPGLNYAVATSTIEQFLKQDGDVREKKTSKKITKEGCGKKPFGEERVSLRTGPAKKIYFDPQCIGRPTVVLIEPDDETKPIILIVEHPEHPGKAGFLITDTNRDGEFDYTLVDSDADGKWDLEGTNKSGELFASDVRPIKG